MSGKPAARVNDPTACPIPGHGTNPITAGSPDVLFDSLPAARQTDPTACGSTLAGNVISNVLINGLPATTLGTIGSHGNVVIAGSGSVIIGNSNTPAPFTPPTPLNIAASATQALAPNTPSTPQRPTDTLARTWQEEPGDKAPLGLEEEDEEEELEEKVQQGITLRVGFFFDGTGDNAANAAIGAMCQAAGLGYSKGDEAELAQHCPPFQRDPLSSYGRQQTNVWRLYNLYQDDSSSHVPAEVEVASIPVYVSGVGTKTGKADTSFPDMALGRGETGVVEKVASSAAAFLERLKLLLGSNPNLLVEKLEIDVFGFSRGAAAARHFVNDLSRGRDSVLGQALPQGRRLLAPSFAWRPGQDIRVNVIGLFDTVAAIGELSDGWNVNDADNGELALHLGPGCAKRVIHLVAADEYRYNFSLNSTAPGFSEIVLPGAHGDIGGNYPAVADEHLFLTRAFRAEVNKDVPRKETQAWRSAEQALAEWQARGLLAPGQSNGRLFIHSWESRSTDNPLRRKVVYAQVKLERQVRGEYGRIPLRIMHALAKEAGTPFEFIEEFDPKLAVPQQLQPIAAKLLAYASKGGPLSMPLEEFQLLRAHYLHQSAHWNVHPGESGALTVHFVNRPTDDLRRTIHPNQSDLEKLLS